MINLFKKIGKNFTKELEFIFKEDQIKILELKNKTTKIKTAIDW